MLRFSMFRQVYIILSLFSFLFLGSCGKEDLPDAIAVSGVVLDVDEVTLDVGDSIKLNAVVLPQNATNKKVSWLSSNENVAVVTSEGVVKALKEGVASVVVVTEDQGVYASCRVVFRSVFLSETVQNLYLRRGFLGNQPLRTRFSWSNTSLIVQNEEKAKTPNNEDMKKSDTHIDAITPPRPNNRKTHQQRVPQ